MSAPPYMKLYWGDYSRKTRHLKRAVEHGAYLLLIGALWDAGGKLPADDATLASHALCTPREWDAMKAKILPFFRVVRGHITQDRVTEELAKYRDTSGKRKLAGKAGGKASHGKHEGNAEAIARQMPTQSESEPKREGKEPSLSAGKPARASRSKRSPEEPLPAGYPDAEAIAEAGSWVAAAGAILDITAQARRFRGHAATKDRRERNWPAAWRQWVEIACEDAPKAGPAAAPVDHKPWPGPSDVWAAVVDARSEAFAVSWLLPCAWQDVPTRALICPSPTAIKRLRRDVGDVLRDMEINLLERAA